MGTMTCVGVQVVGNVSGWNVYNCVVGSLDDNGD